jgi:hypothetical protein
MDFEFETKRTALVSAFAAAGAELLNYMGAAATQAAIPDTQPQKYAIAGTLPGILQMAGKMMGEDGTEQPLTIALGQGLIEVGQGHHGDERLPAILFGRNGAGAVGIETEGNRVMKPGECIAAITFENPQSLDVVAEKLGELRARIWPDAEMLPAKHVIAPHFRGYAHLGIGAYVLNHSAAGEVPELGISIATEEQKAGRVVGDLRGNEPGALVHSKDIAVRLRFENVAGLDALEQQLRIVRSVHFPESDDARYAKLVSQVHYWMDRGDRATIALDAAEAEIVGLRAALASVTPPAAAEKPTGDLTPLPEPGRFEPNGREPSAYSADQMHDYASAAIAAHLARQPKAEQPVRTLDDDFIFGLADTHADESSENGCRRFDRGGLLQFANDLAAHLARQAQAEDLAGYFGWEEGSWVAASSDWPGAVKLYRASVAPAGAQNDLTTVECPTCHNLVGVKHACDDCDGQGKVIVSRKDLASAQNAEAIRNQATDELRNRVASLEAQLVECSALSIKWASSAGEADGRADAARNQALTEAENIARCYDLGTPEGHAIADAIRALQTESANTQEGGSA